MTKRYKTSYKSARGVKRFAVSFDAPTIATQVQECCTICGGEIEESPMMRGVCYGCYSTLVTSPATFAALKEKTEAAAYTAMDAVLGTEPATQRDMESMVGLFMDGMEPSPIISGGEVLYFSDYKSNLHEEEMPF